jgi:nucleoid DNA-binding protein
MQRVAVIDDNRVLARNVRYSTIPYSAIVAYASKAAAVPESSIEMAMEALYDAVNYFVLNGHSVQIPNLGTFSLGVHAKSAASEVEFSANFAKNLKRIILRFLPDTELKAISAWRALALK